MNAAPAGTGPLAIVAAMQEELRAVLAQMPDARIVTAAGRAYWCGHLHGHAVVAVLSRIGKVAAATTTTALLERFNARAVLFTGAAGGLADGVSSLLPRHCYSTTWTLPRCLPATKCLCTGDPDLPPILTCAAR